MKRLTLDETWTLCLRMWKWIAQQRKKGNRESVRVLKYDWLKKHGHKEGRVDEDCFFCEYTERRSEGCNLCPARKIDRNFRCADYKHNWSSKPIPFYAKLVELNKKRLSKKRK